MALLVGEPERAHPRLGDAPAARPGVADGKAHAAVSQPAAVTPVQLLEAPGGVKMADQCQPGSLTTAGRSCLVERQRTWEVEDLRT